MKAGNFRTFKLQHGISTIREFQNVVVRHPDHKGTEVTDRWELEGTELKVEALENGRTRVVKVNVIVGFLPENVIE